MTKLFSENIGSASNNSELAILKKKYNNYDPLYVATSTISTRPEFREWLESLWKQYEPYADSNFLIEFKKQFSQRSWELYLGSTLINRKYTLSTHSSIGPDFKIPYGDKNVWIEAIAVQKGVGQDKVPDIEWGKLMSVPEKEMLLRLTAGLNEKYQKYLSYLKDGLINNNDPFIIAIDRSGLDHPDPQIPLILKCLFGIGHQVLNIKTGKPLPKTEGSNWSSRGEISKASGSNIPMLLFTDNSFEGISAVIYCSNNIINSPRDSNDMGDNFVNVQNPYAKNPLSDNFFIFGEEWIQKDNQLIKIRDSVHKNG